MRSPCTRTTNSINQLAYEMKRATTRGEKWNAYLYAVAIQRYRQACDLRESREKKMRGRKCVADVIFCLFFHPIYYFRPSFLSLL